MIKARIRAMGVLSGAILIATQAHAQEAPAAPPEASTTDEAATSDDASAPGEGDIVVTALRSRTLLQSTPLSIVALTGETLRQTGATQLTDYFRQVPNLSLEAGGGGNQRISIRGINASGEATVGLYYDETPVTGVNGTTQDAGGLAADLNLFDVERLEVLRGPQGTLYGSSSMAGTLRVIFNKPDYGGFDAAIEEQISTTSDGGTGAFFKAMVNAPIVTDVAAVRVAGYYEERQGWIDNVYFNQEGVNDRINWGVRGLIALEPDEYTSIIATIIYQESEADDQQPWFPAVGKYQTASRVHLPNTNEMQLYNLTLNRDLDFATLTATGSYYRFEVLRTFDFTDAYEERYCRSYFSLGNTPCNSSQLATFRATGLATPAVLYQPAFLRSRNFEARLASNEDAMPDWLGWTVGVYYEKRYDYIDSQNVVADANGDVIFPLIFLANRYVETDTRQIAGFGEVSIKPLDGLTATFGIRYFDYEKTTGGESFVSNVAAGAAISPFSSVSTNATGTVKKFNLSYEITPRLMVYAGASQGFRPGGVNNTPTAPVALLAYQPDSLWNYEIGMKSSWLQNRVVFNAAAFHIDWDDIQTSARTADNFFVLLTNAGAARVRGAEAELTLRPTPGFVLGGSIGYIDAKLTADQVNPGFLLSSTTGRAGDRLPGTPPWTASATASYDWPVSDDLNGLVRADFAYTGEMQSQLRPNHPFYTEYGDYYTVGLRGGVENDTMGAYLFVQNLTDEVGVTGTSAGTIGVGVRYSIMPRTVGINVRLSM